MSAGDKYQIMPTQDQLALDALEKSIKKHGVLQPIVVDENGDVLDGHTRQVLASFLGVDCPREVRAGLSEDEKFDLVLQLNASRRHLTYEEKRRLAADAIGRNPKRNDCEIADLIGVSHGFVRGVREFVCNAESPDEDEVMEYGFLPKHFRMLREKLEDAGALGTRDSVATRDGRTIPTPAVARRNRRAIRSTIEREPKKSDRQIASDLGVSRDSVRRERQAMKAGASASRSSAPQTLIERARDQPRDLKKIKKKLIRDVLKAVGDVSLFPEERERGDQLLTEAVEAFVRTLRVPEEQNGEADIAAAPMTPAAKAG